MRRAYLVPFLMSALVAGAAPAVLAASLPSGTITCQIDANTDYGLRTLPYIDSTPGGRIMMKGKLVGTCDSSGVTGGRAPIDGFEATLVAKLAAGTVCTDLITAPDLDKVKLSVKWKGQIEDHVRVLATSRIQLVLGSWDDPNEALVFTGEIFKGAFAGSTTTVKVTLHEPGLPFLNAACPRIEGVFYGTDGESELTVP